MRIDTVAVTVNGPHSPVLEPTTARIQSGQVTVVDGPPGTGHTAFSLLVGGRLAPSAGRVLLNGSPDGKGLRTAVAVVDVPNVSEPDDVVSLATIVGEELAMAGRPARHHHVRDWLVDHDAAVWRRVRVEDVPADVRYRLLAELTALRPGVEAIVLCCPDRYGTDPREAMRVAHDLADRGFAVCLQMTTNTVRAVGDAHASLGGAR